MGWPEYLHNKNQPQIPTELLGHSELDKLFCFHLLRIYKNDFIMLQISFSCSGYMSPEYMMEGAFSTKSDVYSFGVMYLKLLVEEETLVAMMLIDH